MIRRDHPARLKIIPAYQCELMKVNKPSQFLPSCYADYIHHFPFKNFVKRHFKSFQFLQHNAQILFNGYNITTHLKQSFA